MPLLVAPSILASDFSRIQEEISSIEQGGADWIHLDVMDGRFVPNISFGPPVIASVRRQTKLPLDTHLMIEEPERYLEAFRAAGSDIITVHQEACVHLHRTLHRIRELGAKAGVALNPSTPVSVLEPVIKLVDLVLVMTVNPGFGGQVFIPEALEKVRAVAAMTSSFRPPVHVEVDGGIDEQSSPLCVEAGANVLVAGTSVFRSPDRAKAIRALRDASRETS